MDIDLDSYSKDSSSGSSSWLSLSIASVCGSSQDSVPTLNAPHEGSVDSKEAADMASQPSLPTRAADVFPARMPVERTYEMEADRHHGDQVSQKA